MRPGVTRARANSGNGKLRDFLFELETNSQAQVILMHRVRAKRDLKCG
jgi:hypothetical protein